jgi:hypothetical protein
MRIKNINGIFQSTCSCESWFKHWERFSRQSTSYCHANGCLNQDILGAHVQKAMGTDKNWYIFPLFTEHNNHVGELKMSDYYELVSTNKKETCEV